MLFRKTTWAGLADGSITVAFRWWKRPTVRVGGTLKSPGGLLAFDAVEVVDPADLDAADATAAGFDSLGQLRDDVAATDPGDPERRLHRIAFHRVGDDPRAALRADADLDATAVADLRARLDRMDRAAEAPWTRAVLALIAEHPGTVSTDLAARLDLDRPRFKQRVRRLKELGLTESLDVGYRLSPRGAALLPHLR